MANIIVLNSYIIGSTGRIMVQIGEAASKYGHEVYYAYPASRTNYNKSLPNKILVGNIVSRNIGLNLSTLTGFNGCFSIRATKRFIKTMDKIKPDIIHLHNLHNSYINLDLLFKYIKKHKIPIIWTLHDCWAFTGQCPHFTFVQCDRWKKECHHCPQYRQYPKSYVDRAKTMYRLKRKWFTGVANMTIVTPSQWLAGFVKQSYLKEYPIKVINNGIDLNIFKPTLSHFREERGLGGKYIVLGVALGWGKRKGLDIFIELVKRLDPARYQIVLVGTDNAMDKQLPDSIISVHRTNDQHELAEIYTAADLFVNPTREENYPTVNMEAIACGTPVVTFKTGGSPEILDEKTGVVVDCGDIEAILKQITRICETKPYSKDVCLERAKLFDMNDRFGEYVDLYKELSETKNDSPKAL